MPRKKQEEVQKPKQLKITLVKSTIAVKPAIRKTVEAMGLKKLNSSVIMPDNEAVRGMVFKVKHLVTVDEI
jgi:large subunit ribosomal protein L30